MENGETDKSLFCELDSIQIIVSGYGIWTMDSGLPNGYSLFCHRFTVSILPCCLLFSNFQSGAYVRIRLLHLFNEIYHFDQFDISALNEYTLPWQFSGILSIFWWPFGLNSINNFWSSFHETTPPQQTNTTKRKKKCCFDFASVCTSARIAGTFALNANSCFFFWLGSITVSVPISDFPTPFLTHRQFYVQPVCVFLWFSGNDYVW